MSSKQEQQEINKHTLDAYVNEIRELRDTVNRLKEERVVLLNQRPSSNEDQEELWKELEVIVRKKLDEIRILKQSAKDIEVRKLLMQTFTITRK